MITKNLHKNFIDKGFLIIRNFLKFYEINQYIEELNQIGCSFDLDFDVHDKIKVKSANGKFFFKVIRNPLFLYEMSLKLKKISKELGCKIPVMGPSYVRVDITEESAHQFDWHQDYTCLLGSPKMFTYWIPLTNVSKKNGSLEIIPGSHKFGILKSRPKNNEKKLTSGNLVINKNHKKIKLNKKIILNLKAGDLAVFSPLIVHRSFYPRIQKQPRITSIIRLDDAGDKNHIELGFMRNDLDKKNIFSCPNYKKY